MVTPYLPEKLMHSELVQKLPTFYGRGRFITAYTGTGHLSISNSFLPLFWAYHGWGIKQGLGIVTCNAEDLLVIVCVFREVFLTALYFRVTYCPTFRACAPFRHVPYVRVCPWEGLGNIRHLHEWGTSYEGGVIICNVGCI
jgi:hypothetical protein